MLRLWCLLFAVLCSLFSAPAHAAWASAGFLGANNNKTSGTNNLVITTGAAAEAGNVIVVIVAANNVDTTDVESTLISISDSAGNSYSRAKEFTNGQGGAGNGATAGIYWTVVSTELAAAGTITITTTSAIVAKAASAWEFTIAGNVVTVEGSATRADDGADPGAVTISSLASGEYLWVAAVAHEGPTTDNSTLDADYTAINGSGTEGGGTATNMSARGGHRIFTGTTDTWDMTFTAVDHAQVFVALKEAAGEPPPPRDPGRGSLLGVGG